MDKEQYFTALDIIQKKALQFNDSEEIFEVAKIGANNICLRDFSTENLSIIHCFYNSKTYNFSTWGNHEHIYFPLGFDQLLKFLKFYKAEIFKGLLLFFKNNDYFWKWKNNNSIYAFDKTNRKRSFEIYFEKDAPLFILDKEKFTLSYTSSEKEVDDFLSEYFSKIKNVLPYDEMLKSEQHDKLVFIGFNSEIRENGTIFYELYDDGSSTTYIIKITKFNTVFLKEYKEITTKKLLTLREKKMTTLNKLDIIIDRFVNLDVFDAKIKAKQQIIKKNSFENLQTFNNFDFF